MAIYSVDHILDYISRFGVLQINSSYNLYFLPIFNVYINTALVHYPFEGVTQFVFPVHIKQYIVKTNFDIALC